MSFNYSKVSNELFYSEVEKIPEPYRTEFIDIVQQSQKVLETKIYTGEAGAGLLKIAVNSKAGIVKLEIDKTLFEQNNNLDKFNNIVSDLAAVAHSNAVNAIQENVDKELAKLYSKILAITELFMQSPSGGQ
jgi:DNA-binding protein YbaB